MSDPLSFILRDDPPRRKLDYEREKSIIRNPCLPPRILIPPLKDLNLTPGANETFLRLSSCSRRDFLLSLGFNGGGSSSSFWLLLLSYPSGRLYLLANSETSLEIKQNNRDVKIKELSFLRVKK